jgi:hypothetical protein
VSKKKKEAPPATTALSSTANKESNTEAQKVKPSWRDFYNIYPAADFFHEFSTAEQLKDLRKDIDKQGVILEPIHTASVPGHPKPFVIDGISRLDAAEETGHQIVNEKGEWTGMLVATGGINRHVVHHPGKTDKEVWDLVISLNLKRRHLTTGQLAEIADKLATKPRGGDRRSKPKADQTTETEFDSAPTVKQAAEMVGVSETSVHEFRKVKKEAPEKIKDIRSGKLSPSKAVSEIDADKGKAKRSVLFLRAAAFYVRRVSLAIAVAHSSCGLAGFCDLVLRTF